MGADEDGVEREKRSERKTKSRKPKMPKKPKKKPKKVLVSPACKDLIRKLLVKDQKRRLGYVAGAGAIKAEPFFLGLKWGLLRNEKAPIMPPEEQYQFIATGDSAGEAIGRRLPEVLQQLEDAEKAEIRKEKAVERNKKQQLLAQAEAQRIANGGAEIVQVDGLGQLQGGVGLGMQWRPLEPGTLTDTGSPPGGDEAAQAELTAWKDFHYRPAASMEHIGADGETKASMRLKKLSTYGSDRPSSTSDDPRGSLYNPAEEGAAKEGAAAVQQAFVDTIKENTMNAPSDAEELQSPRGGRGYKPEGAGVSAQAISATS